MTHSHSLYKSQFFRNLSICEVIIGLLGVINLLLIFTFLKLPNNGYYSVFFLELYFVVCLFSILFIFVGAARFFLRRIPFVLNLALYPLISVLIVIHALAFYFLWLDLSQNGFVLRHIYAVTIAYGNAVFSFGNGKIIAIAILLVILMFSQDFRSRNKLKAK